MDKAGAPYCTTIDSQTLHDETVTIRERDSMPETRQEIPDLVRVMEAKIGF